ncbi:unnamed protein product [Amoebophrya sp. A120]|nr:unnamed protein product [Amoebophrya sp. A120]|eukprot:GSA120T00017243001.1
MAIGTDFSTTSPQPAETSTASSSPVNPRVWQGSFIVETANMRRRESPMYVMTNPTLSVALIPDLPTEEIFCDTERKKLKAGILCLYCPAQNHCSLSMNENCDSTVRKDMLEALRRIANGSGTAKENKNNQNTFATNATVFDLLTTRSLAIPVSNGQLMLGTWQGVYLFYDNYFCSAEQNGPPKVFWALIEGAEYERTEYSANHAGSFSLGTYLKETTLSNEEESDSQFHCLTHLHTHHTSASLCLRDKEQQAFKEKGNSPEKHDPKKPKQARRIAALAKQGQKSNSVDLEREVMNEVVLDRWNDEFFEHTYEGRDDMTGHLKCTLLGCSTILDLNSQGRSKNAVLNEHREGRSLRKISLVHVLYSSQKIKKSLEEQAAGAAALADSSTNSTAPSNKQVVEIVIDDPSSSSAPITDVTELVIQHVIGRSSASTAATAPAVLFVGVSGPARLVTSRSKFPVDTLKALCAREYWYHLLPSSAMIPLGGLRSFDSGTRTAGEEQDRFFVVTQAGPNTSAIKLTLVSL